MQARPPRIFTADQILTGQILLDSYPWRYVCIGLSPSTALGTALGGRAGADARLDQVLSAAEYLEGRGWEVVSIDQGGTLVFMRRRM
jgi:hypothetical protein